MIPISSDLNSNLLKTLLELWNFRELELCLSLGLDFACFLTTLWWWRSGSLAWPGHSFSHLTLRIDGVTIWELAGDAGVSEGVPGDAGGWNLCFLRLQCPGNPLPVSSKCFGLGFKANTSG